jgi:hypothetical protein
MLALLGNRAAHLLQAGYRQANEEKLSTSMLMMDLTRKLTCCCRVFV